LEFPPDHKLSLHANEYRSSPETSTGLSESHPPMPLKPDKYLFSIGWELFEHGMSWDNGKVQDMSGWGC